LQPDGEYLQRAWRNSVYPIASRMGVPIKLPNVSPQPYTRLAFEGLEFAKDRGKGDDYNSRVMRAFFQQSRNIGDMDVLAKIASEAGLDEAEFRRALTSGEYSSRVQELLRHSSEDIGVTGVPLFVIGTRTLSGLQDRETLEAAIREAQNAERK
jgi:predicted DsbA family dithiol-disulfide isomerase